MHAARTTTSFPLLRLAAGTALFCALAACGYKGPLYMPPPPAPDASLTTPPRAAGLPETDTPAAAPDTTAPDASAVPSRVN